MDTQPDYAHDGLAVWGKNVSFLKDPRFVRAYNRGMDSGHKIARPAGSRADIHIEWRVHTLIWAAQHALHLPGDFVECGVNTGIFSLAICDYIDFNSTRKDFWLFDTFCGIPVEQISPSEQELDRANENTVAYEECYTLAKKNFAPFPRARLVRGKIPDTLTSVPIGNVCYLSLDLNIAQPEVAALTYFWEKLVPGAPVILDDYGWQHWHPQKEAMDAFARDHGVTILTLPTGQGLLLKPK
ncbi:MAG: TylF/MycF/NovP-related O-methyltransferase [Parcubacteria group bacterium]